MTVNDHAQRIIDSETGYRRDLRSAENAIADSGDPVLAEHLRRHSEAVRNMMVAEMIPSFQKALQPLLVNELAPVVTGIGGLQLSISQLNSEFQTLSAIVSDLQLGLLEGKQDRLLIRHEVNALKDEVTALQLAFSEYQKGNRRAEIDYLYTQIAEIRGSFDSNERKYITTILLAMIKEYEETHSE